jgi:hypothetical protein
MSAPWVTVVETTPWLNRVGSRMTEDESDEATTQIAKEPECGDVIPGTGGVRKLRFGVGSKGKSGGVRIIYYYYNATRPAFLLTVFAKKEKDNLTKGERNELAKLVKQLLDAY